MNQHSKLAIIGLILGIVAICCFLLSFILPAEYCTQTFDEEYMCEISICPILCIIMTVILSILAIILGAVSYWGRWKDKLGLADFIIGIIVLIIWLITSIYVYIMPTGTGTMYGTPLHRPKVK